MPYSTDVAAARALAEKLHQGQTDKANQSYINHPRRVAERLRTPQAQVVAWLHDTVEDTGITLSEIEALFGYETCLAVDALTHREGEAWRDYIERVRQNPVAREVKISDLIDNSNLSRLPNVTLKDVLRQAKYNQALQRLLSDI